MGTTPPNDSAPDLVEALVARVDEIDAQLRATTAAIDEKSLREFRKTVEAITKRDAKFEQRLSNKVSVVADRIETVARTVSTTSAALAAKDGEIAQLQRQLDAGTDRVDSALAELRRGLDPSALNEVKRTVQDIAKQKLPRGLEGRIDELGAKVTMLAQRIDTVSSTVSTTASGLAGRDGDVIALRRAYEADSNRLGAELAELRRAFDPAFVAELKQTVSELRAQSSGERRFVQNALQEASAKADALAGRLEPIAASHTAIEARVSTSEEQLGALRGRVEESSGNMSSLATAVAAASERLDSRDVELENLERRFHDASARVDGLIAELTQALTELPDPSSTQELVHARFTELDQLRVHDRVRIEELAERLETVAMRIEDTTRQAPESEGLELRLDDLEARVEAAADSRPEISREVTRLAAVLEVERAAVRSRLDSLAAAQEGAIGAVSAEELQRRVTGFDARVDTMERERDALTARIDGLKTSFESERGAFQTQLEALAKALSWTSPKSGGDERVEELDRRLASLERRSAVVASKVAQATTLIPAALRSLEARLNEIAPRTPGQVVTDQVEPLGSALQGIESDVDPADAEHDEDETPNRLPVPVVPIRGSDP